MQTLNDRAIVKRYAGEGPLELCRLDSPLAFLCSRCDRAKTSRLVAVAGSDPRRLFCNACYGTLLSIVRVKRDMARSDMERESELIALVLEAIGVSDAEEAARVSGLGFEDALAPEARRFLGTAAIHLVRLRGLDLDWSGSVLLLSKAVELELTSRIFEPLRAALERSATPIVFPRRLHRLETYCKAPPDRRRVELGAAAQLLDVLSSSAPDADEIVVAYARLVRRAAPPDPSSTSRDLGSDVTQLARKFRNPAAHSEVVTEEQFLDCLNLVTGKGGILRQILIATG